MATKVRVTWAPEAVELLLLMGDAGERGAGVDGTPPMGLLAELKLVHFERRTRGRAAWVLTATGWAEVARLREARA